MWWCGWKVSVNSATPWWRSDRGVRPDSLQVLELRCQRQGLAGAVARGSRVILPACQLRHFQQDFQLTAPGSVFAPDEPFVVDVDTLQHKNALTPYDGRTLTGVVRSTWLRGAAIDIEADPRGRLLTRGGPG